MQLATSLQQWVGVSSERMKTLKLLELPDVFTTDMSGSFFQVHPFYLVAKSRRVHVVYFKCAVLCVEFMAERLIIN